MLSWKIILSILLFVIAILPVFIKSDSVYQSPIIKTIMTVFLILILIVNIGIVFFEKKERENEKIEREKIEREHKELIKLTSELDNYINFVEIKLTLNGMYSVEDLNPIYFGYEFMVYDKNIDIKEVIVSNDRMRRGNEVMLSYKIYDAKRGGTSINSSLYGGLGISAINSLYSKIQFPENTYTFREFNKGMLMIYLKEDLIDKVTNIRLEINGWILINEKISSDKWEKLNDISRVGGWGNYGLEEKTYYRISPQYTQSFDYHPWQIDLFNKKISKNEAR